MYFQDHPALTGTPPSEGELVVLRHPLTQELFMNMQDKVSHIWSDGEMLASVDAKTHLLTHTLHYGVGCFEGLRAYETANGPAIFRLEDHTQRLFDSAQILGMEVKFTQEEINQAQQQVIVQNKLESCYIRPLVYYGSEGMGLRAEGLQTHVMVAAWSWGSYFTGEQLENGIDVGISSYQRINPQAYLVRAKACGNYINSMMAVNEAIKNGFHEALLLDGSGHVSEGSSENVFLVKDGTIYTPPLTSCLNGITRKTIITIANDLGYQVEEKFLTRDDFYIADEAFFSGTAAEITPIASVDRRKIGGGGRGKITKVLQQLYFDIVAGKEKKYQDWLTYCG